MDKIITRAKQRADMAAAIGLVAIANTRYNRAMAETTTSDAATSFAREAAATDAVDKSASTVANYHSADADLVYALENGRYAGKTTTATSLRSCAADTVSRSGAAVYKHQRALLSRPLAWKRPARFREGFRGCRHHTERDICLSDRK